jgi:hypothetical protein
VSGDVEVTDPAHPLYGRRFSIISVSHPPQHAGHVVVAYWDFMRLRLPVLATSLAPSCASPSRTKLTRKALLDLLALVQECATPCPAPPDPSGADSTRD